MPAPAVREAHAQPAPARKRHRRELRSAGPCELIDGIAELERARATAQAAARSSRMVQGASRERRSKSFPSFRSRSDTIAVDFGTRPIPILLLLRPTGSWQDALVRRIRSYGNPGAALYSTFGAPRVVARIARAVLGAIPTFGESWSHTLETKDIGRFFADRRCTVVRTRYRRNQVDRTRAKGT